MEAAIKACRGTLTSSGTSEVIAVVSDGDPTARVGTNARCASNSGNTPCKAAAATEADAAKADGIILATAFVFDTAGEGSDFLKNQISSDPVNLAVTDTATPDAVELATNIVNIVSPCSSD